MKHTQIWNEMFLLLLALLVVTNMWNKKFWLIIAGSPPLYKGDWHWSSVFSWKNERGYTFFKKERGWLNSRGMKVAKEK